MEASNKELEDKSEHLKLSIDKYEKEKRQEILQMNNDIAKNNAMHELIKVDIGELNTESEKMKSKKLSRMSELAQILMAIDNIEQKCFNRKYDESYGKSNRQSILKHQVPVDSNMRPRNYDDFVERHGFAKKQLDVIDHYAQDFKEIVNGLNNNKENAEVRRLL